MPSGSPGPVPDPVGDNVPPVSVTPHSPDSAEAARVTGNEAWAIVSRILSGMLLYGAIGYAVGLWLDKVTLGLSVGILVGVVLGLYLSVLSIRSLGDTAQERLVVTSSGSWSARMTRARMQRAKDVDGE